jgi:NAD(P)-dependent dehydrogenase (short-subunit alcohol dehydrogenase family)
VEVEGRTAIVTGAAHGIGRVVAERLAALGASVVIADLDSEAASHAAAEIAATGARASCATVDVAQAKEVERLVAAVDGEHGGVDILVNNAGGYDKPVFPDARLDHVLRAIDLNFRAVVFGIHFAVRSMARRGGGAIVNVASSAGLGLAPHPSPEYAAAKAAVMRLTATLASLADRGIRVNCICPHTVATSGVLRTMAELQEKGEELPAPLRDELIAPEALADGVVRLVRDESLAGRILVYRGAEQPRLLAAE